MHCVQQLLTKDRFGEMSVCAEGAKRFGSFGHPRPAAQQDDQGPIGWEPVAHEFESRGCALWRQVLVEKQERRRPRIMGAGLRKVQERPRRGYGLYVEAPSGE